MPDTPRNQLEVTSGWVTCWNKVVLGPRAWRNNDGAELFQSAESRLSLSPQPRAELALGYFHLANKFVGQERLNQAEAAYRASIRLYEKLCAEYRTNASYQGLRAAATRRLASLVVATDRSREAVKLYRELLQIEARDCSTMNNLAWLLSTCTEASVRDPARAVELAKKAVELAPKEGTHWNTLGVAHYRADDWKAAIDALTKSMELRKGGDSNDWFFLAMAHWQLGDKDAGSHLVRQGRPVDGEEPAQE